jgi:hypothetical protein
MELATKINHPISMKGGDEMDAFSLRARKIMSFGSGVKAYSKRRYWKRARKVAKVEVGNEIVSWNVEPMATKDTQ